MTDANLLAAVDALLAWWDGGTCNEIEMYGHMTRLRGCRYDYASRLDAVYAERDRLVAALSRCFPSAVADATDPEPGFSSVVLVALPSGQVSWHVRDDELPWFDHLQRGTLTWDGHTNDEKNRRLAALGQGARRG